MTTTLCRLLLLVVLVTQHCHAAHHRRTSSIARRGRRMVAHQGPDRVTRIELARTASAADRVPRARTLEAILMQIKTEWNISVSNHGVEGSPVARLTDEHELGSHLVQVLEVSDKLLQSARACLLSSPSQGPTPTPAANQGAAPGAPGSPGAADSHCAAAAPELLRGRTASFLSSLLRTYPHGPTTREAMTSWVAATSAFLETHQRLQRAQRQRAQQAADASYDIWTRSESALAAAAAAAKTAAPVGHQGTPVPAAAVAAGGSGTAATPAWATTGGADRSTEGAGDYGDADTRRQRQLGVSVGERAGSEDGEEGEAGDGRDDVCSPAGPASGFLDTFPGLEYGGLPLVRRVVLAQLLLGWMTAMRQGVGAGQEVSPVAEADLARVVTLLYDIHVESVAQRALMEYFHISKAGGTSWTAAAVASGCHRPRANAARFRDFDDDCRWINGSLLREHGINVRRTSLMQVCSRFDVTQRQTRIRSCEDRLRHALASGFQYVSNEYTLHGGLNDMYDTRICPQFVNVISIREPLERMVSNIKYMLVRLRSTLFRKPPHTKLFAELFCNAPAERWEQYSPPVVDNYMIRTLVGEREFHTPLHGIGETTRAVAKQLLLQYDLVLDLNAGDEAADLLMREGLGWNKTLAEVRVWTLEKMTKKSGLDLEAECRVGDLTPLLQRQQYDLRWYGFGRTLSRLDHLFLSAATQLGDAAVAHVLGPDGGRGGGRGEGDAADRCGLLGASQALRGA